jgi:hypothetical protein
MKKCTAGPTRQCLASRGLACSARQHVLWCASCARGCPGIPVELPPATRMTQGDSLQMRVQAPAFSLSRSDSCASTCGHATCQCAQRGFLPRCRWRPESIHQRLSAKYFAGVPVLGFGLCARVRSASCGWATSSAASLTRRHRPAPLIEALLRTRPYLPKRRRVAAPS